MLEGTTRRWERFIAGFGNVSVCHRWKNGRDSGLRWRVERRSCVRVIAVGLGVFRGKQTYFQSRGHAQAEVVSWTRTRVVYRGYSLPGNLVVLYKAIGRYVGNNVGQ